MFKLALNAGHGKNTLGKRCMKKLDKNQTREWVLNSRICEKIEKKLLAYEGYALIRLDDPTGKKDIALKKRTDTANKFGADFYLSIHANAGVNGKDGGGIETYVYTNASKEALEWQDELYKALINHTDLKGNRADGTRKANLHECRESNMPCVLVEAGFMDSKTDVPIILTDKFAEQVAKACVEVIVKKAKLKKKAVKKVYTGTMPKLPTRGYFKIGDSGAQVKYLQKFLNWYGNYKLVVDGIFGTATEKAVKAFQKKNKLEADGKVGTNTHKCILSFK